MRCKSKFVIPVVLLLLSVSISAAQEDYDFSRFSYKGEAFGSVGSGTWSFDDSGFILGGGVVFRPYPKAGFEIHVRHIQSDEEYAPDNGDYWRNEDTGVLVTGAVHYYFSQLRFQPYVLLGGGYGKRQSKSVYRTLGIDYQDEFDEASVVIEAGGGVNAFITNKISVRPDVRLTIGAIGSVQGSVNLCYHW